MFHSLKSISNQCLDMGGNNTKSANSPIQQYQYCLASIHCYCMWVRGVEHFYLRDLVSGVLATATWLGGCHSWY